MPIAQTPSHDTASQVQADTAAVIPDPNGTIPPGVGVYFHVTPTDPEGDTVRMEVELHQLPAGFIGTPNFVSPYVASGTVATTETASVLPAGNYGWRYRVVDSGGHAGEWVNESNPNFIVLSTGQTPPLEVKLAGDRVVLSWPITANDYFVEYANSLVTPNWAPLLRLPQQPQMLDGRFYVENLVDVDGERFFRLRGQ